MNYIFPLSNLRWVEFLLKIEFLDFALQLSMALYTFYKMYTLGLSFQLLRDLYYYSERLGEDAVVSVAPLVEWCFLSLRFYIIFRILASPNMMINNRVILLLFVAILNLALLDLSTGGRIYIFYIISLMLFYGYTNGWVYVNNQIIRRMKKFLILLVMVVFTISINRLSTAGADPLRFLYQYFVGPIFLFQSAISDINGFQAIDELRFGASFTALDWFIVGLIKIFGVQLNSITLIMNPILSTGYLLDNNEGINAFFTGFLTFYLDFGFLGSLISGILFGSILGILARVCYKKNVQFYLYLYLLFSFIYLMFIRDNLLSSPWILALIFLSAFTSKIAVAKSTR